MSKLDNMYEMCWFDLFKMASDKMARLLCKQLYKVFLISWMKASFTPELILNTETVKYPVLNHCDIVSVLSEPLYCCSLRLDPLSPANLRFCMSYASSPAISPLEPLSGRCILFCETSSSSPVRSRKCE